MNTLNSILLDNDWKVALYPSDTPDYSVPDPTGLDFMPAKVPGAVQYDLMSAGRLENPYASTQAAFDSAWVAKSDWLYESSFTLTQIPDDCRWFLNIDGIDTYSEIWLGGTMIGETRNNYRFYEFPVDKTLLHVGNNVLHIRVKGHHRMVLDQIEAAGCLGHDSNDVEGLMGKSLIRRYQRSFFGASSLLNIGTGVLGIGINRLVTLSYYRESRITDWVFRTLSLKNGTATCELMIETDGSDGELQATITNPETGVDIVAFNCAVKKGKHVFPIEVFEPELWWPAGYGKPFLYRLSLKLMKGECCIHSLEHDIGIKTVEIITKLDNGRNTFHFRVNDKRIWVRGQNTIPLDYIKVYGDPTDEQRIFRLLENAQTNMVRVWGGGMPELDSFYEACNRLGIMLWVDGFLHSNVYPDYDPEFVEEYKQECYGLLKRMRRHVALSVVCGGNELIEGWEEYGWQSKIDRFYGESLFTHCLPAIAKELCPEIPYIVNCPHGGVDTQSPTTGDTHNWGNYFNAFKDPLFVSETCWSQESYSRPETLEKRMDINVDDYQGKCWFDNWTKQTTRPRIGRLAYSNWPHHDNPNLRRYLHTLELEQARADYHALRLFRLRSPSNSGVIYWSFNKGGPLFQFGCVDYLGYPMMSYYVVKRLNKGVVSGIFRDGDEINVVVSNQSGSDFEGTVELLHLHADGDEINGHITNVSLTDGHCKKVFSSANLYDTVIDRTKEVFYLRLRDKYGIMIDEDILFMCLFSEFDQRDTTVKANIVRLSDHAWELSLIATCVIRQFEIESNQKLLCSDNYFPMAPGEVKKVQIEILERTSDEVPCLKLQTLGIDTQLHITLE